MVWRRKAFIVATLIAAITFGFAMASVAADITYVIAGIETGFTDTSSSFAGFASGYGALALWEAVIERTLFDVNRDATITGGSFRLDNLQGVIIGGTIQNITSRCRKETFAVEGNIGLVDDNGNPTGGSGTFTATLRHYRTRIFGECVTYSATVEGTVTFTLP